MYYCRLCSLHSNDDQASLLLPLPLRLYERIKLKGKGTFISTTNHAFLVVGDIGVRVIDNPLPNKIN